MRAELQESQRYGRNKDTVVNHAYISSGAYRSKFDKISNSKELNRIVYQCAKRMLEHRSGTLYEDMYWIDLDTLKVVASETKQKIEGKIHYSKKTRKAISKYENLLVIHSHPNSMPPSISDFNSAHKNGYEVCIVCCHDGKIFLYQSSRNVIEFFYRNTIAKYKRMGYDEFESQKLAVGEYEEKGDISFKEVL